VKGAFEMKKISILLLLPIAMILTSCSSGDSSSGGQVDYDQTKKMVVDILKTDDGKKAIQDVMSDDSMKQKLVMDQQVVSNTIQQTLTSDKATDFWKKTFSDPKFAQGIAKNMKSENQKLLKELMNDPEYRAMMIQVFKEPEIQKDLADALKTKDYRTHLQQVISETIESPLFEAKMEQLLLKAAENISKGKTGGSSKSSTQAGGSQGGGGGQGGGT
jgi:spore germination protein D